MIAFRLTDKNRSALLAGARDLGVLSFILCASGRLGPDSQGTRGLADRIDIDLDLRGSTARADRHTNESLIWHRSKPGVGDTITIEVIEADQADEPARRRSKSLDRSLLLPMRRRHARRRRGPYKRRHVMYPVQYND